MELVRLLGIAAVLVSAYAAAEETASDDVLLLVPPGASIAAVQRARTAVAARGNVLLVGEDGTIPVREGVSIVADRTIASPFPAAAVAVLPGTLTDGMVRFLAAERALSRAILFPESGPAIDRVRRAPGNALIAIGGLEVLPELLARPMPEPAAAASARPAAPPAPPPARARSATLPAEPSAEAPAANAPASAKPASAAMVPVEKAAEPSQSGEPRRSVFDRYFSTGASAKDRPKPVPPN